ncbi:MAG: plasmid pRiA4b ORF-3 family protein, partial [Treponema sp.]|nr:plasmid pRiA4b ORF-3 family protein [Treponema sp.]
KVIPVEDGAGAPPPPRCLDGKRAGPPEDCGGIWGYEEMLEIVKNPAHKRYEETHEWLGDVDPEYFNPEEVNTRLEQVFGKKPSAKKAPSRRTKKN